MKAKPIIPTLLFALSLLALTAGTACSSLNSDSEQKDAKSSAARNSQDSPAVKQAQQELDNDKAKLKTETEDAKKIGDGLREAKAKEDGALPGRDKDRAHQTVVNLEAAATNANANVTAANSKVTEAQKRLDDARGGGGDNNNLQSGGGGGSGDGLFAYLPSISTVLIVFSSLLILVALVFILRQLINSSRANTEAHFAGIKKRQDEYARQTREALTALNTSVNNRISELQSDIRELRRSVQDDNRAILDGVRRTGASSSTYAGYSSSGYAAQSPRFEKEEPAFPVAAEEFLNKNRRDAVVVKPDFQNGVLVQDADGNGELVLVRDYGAPDELLYVVPRISYFQTKQDFYNYYDRYYECARPSAGTVWIVQPAVVDRDGGGWSLREKGELEVR
jgi:hypothetical protein